MEDAEQAFRALDATNPENPGERYKSPLNGGPMPIPRSMTLARAIARRFGVEKGGTEMEAYLLELARFCEAESGLPQAVEGICQAAARISRGGGAAVSARPGIVLPLPRKGELRMDVTPLRRAELAGVLALLGAALEGAVDE